MSQKPSTGSVAGDQEFFTVAEVAQRLRCKPRTIINRIRSGAIQAVRIDGTRRWLIPAGEYFRYKSILLDGAWE